MTKAIEMIKNIIESYLWYDGEVYPIVDDTNQVSYATTGLRMGSYSGNTGWLKIISTYEYNGYTFELMPLPVDNIQVVLQGTNFVVEYYDENSTQAEIAAVIQASDYATTATAENGTDAVVDDTSVGTLRGGKFVVKRKEGGHIGMDVDQAELYNIKLESNTEENVKAMVTNLRLLNNNINSFSYVWETSGYPFSLKFGDADDAKLG